MSTLFNKRQMAREAVKRRPLPTRYMDAIPRLIAAVFLMCSVVANAGGSYFPIKILEIRSDGDEFEFSATLEGDFNYDSSANCESITVSGNFDTIKWQSYTKLIDSSVHLEALEILNRASVEEKSINLGYIGQGFHKVGDCNYRSKGLFHDDTGVFSIYARI